VDLTPSGGFNENHTTTICGQGNPTKSDIVALGKKTGFTQKKMDSLYDLIYSVVKESSFDTFQI
jgi:D-serine dehydratase